MFHEITLKNFRTHKSTTIKLYPITLLIGNNNSGKTNLLAGIQHFCEIICHNFFQDQGDRSLSLSEIIQQDILPSKHRFAKREDEVGFSIVWSKNKDCVKYSIDISYKHDSYDVSLSFLEKNIFLKEEIAITIEDEEFVSTETHKPIDRDSVRTLADKINNRYLENIFREFIYDLSKVLFYHLQPSFLKDSNALNEKTLKIYIPEVEEFDFFRMLKSTGANFQRVLWDFKQKDEYSFTKFIALMRRFDRSFQDISRNQINPGIVWNFDWGGKGIIEEFDSRFLSDGFIKAAVISLLASVRMPPSLILLEEIENGINPANIQEIVRWIWQMTSLNSDHHSSQFILTSHSPSVLREFHDYLDHVYTVRLDKRNSRSDVRNLNDALDTLIGIGTIEGETIDHENGKHLVNIPKYQLADLWYSGIIG
ncbi:MAG: AAA family ATPase [Cyanobacteria bacterium P01_G01_bin.54]